MDIYTVFILCSVDSPLDYANFIVNLFFSIQNPCSVFGIENSFLSVYSKLMTVSERWPIPR